MQFLGHTYIPLNYDKQHFITVSNFCDTIRGNTLSDLTLITIEKYIHLSFNLNGYLIKKKFFAQTIKLNLIPDMTFSKMDKA